MSFYICKTRTEIVNLVKMQPNPRFFFKTFLELDGCNMVQILAFDSKSMMYLLQDKNKSYFDEKFPLIYKCKLQKLSGKGFFYRSCLETAIRNNQIRGLQLMIDFIVKYQNNYTSSFLFTKILPGLLEKSLRLE